MAATLSRFGTRICLHNDSPRDNNFILGILQSSRESYKMADVSSKKRKHNDDHGSEKKKKKAAADSTRSSTSQALKVSSVVQPQVSPPVVGMFPICFLLPNWL